MIKVVVALKSGSAFTCQVQVNQKVKSITLPQSEGIIFSVDTPPEITIYYRDEEHRIVNSDAAELQGEFKFNDVKGSYFIMVIQEEELPQKLQVTQNESPVRQSLTQRSRNKPIQTSYLFTDRKADRNKKNKTSTPTLKRHVLTESSRLQVQESCRFLNQSESFQNEFVMESNRNENNNGNHIEIDRLQQQILTLKLENEQLKMKNQQSNLQQSHYDLLNKYENQLEGLAKQYSSMQQRYEKDITGLVDQFSLLQNQYNEILQEKQMLNVEISKLKSMMMNKDIQISTLTMNYNYQNSLQDMQQVTEAMLSQYSQIITTFKDYQISDPQITDNLIKQILLMRMAGAPYLPVKDDKIDVKLSQSLLKESGFNHLFIRLKEGHYRVDDQLVNISIQEQKLLISTQESAIQLVDYLKSKKKLKMVRRM